MAFVNTTPEPVYNDEISLSEFSPRVVVVTLKNGKEVAVPLRLMSDDDKAKLKTVADETKQLRIAGMRFRCRETEHRAFFL